MSWTRVINLALVSQISLTLLSLMAKRIFRWLVRGCLLLFWSSMEIVVAILFLTVLHIAPLLGRILVIKVLIMLFSSYTFDIAHIILSWLPFPFPLVCRSHSFMAWTNHILINTCIGSYLPAGSSISIDHIFALDIAIVFLEILLLVVDRIIDSLPKHVIITNIKDFPHVADFYLFVGYGFLLELDWILEQDWVLLTYLWELLAVDCLDLGFVLADVLLEVAHLSGFAVCFGRLRFSSFSLFVRNIRRLHFIGVFWQYFLIVIQKVLILVAIFSARLCIFVSTGHLWDVASHILLIHSFLISISLGDSSELIGLCMLSLSWAHRCFCVELGEFSLELRFHGADHPPVLFEGWLSFDSLLFAIVLGTGLPFDGSTCLFIANGSMFIKIRVRTNCLLLLFLPLAVMCAGKWPILIFSHILSGLVRPLNIFIQQITILLLDFWDCIEVVRVDGGANSLMFVGGVGEVIDLSEGFAAERGGFFWLRVWGCIAGVVSIGFSTGHGSLS